VLLDDDERPGVMFAEMELIGIPHRITVGERALKSGQVAHVDRRSLQVSMVPIADALRFISVQLETA
jgi:prolyl-tRNA synthetase